MENVPDPWSAGAARSVWRTRPGWQERRRNVSACPVCGRHDDAVGPVYVQMHVWLATGVSAEVPAHPPLSNPDVLWLAKAIGHAVDGFVFDNLKNCFVWCVSQSLGMRRWSRLTIASYGMVSRLAANCSTRSFSPGRCAGELVHEAVLWEIALSGDIQSDSLSVAEGVQFLESVWQSLCTHPRDLRSPEWYRKVLDDRSRLAGSPVPTARQVANGSGLAALPE